MLCCAVQCRGVQGCAVVCSGVQWCAVVSCGELLFAVLHSAGLGYGVLGCTVLWCAVLWCAIVIGTYEVQSIIPGINYYRTTHALPHSFKLLDHR